MLAGVGWMGGWLVALPRAQPHGGGLQLAVVAQLRVSEGMAQDTGSTDSLVQREAFFPPVSS